MNPRVVVTLAALAIGAAPAPRLSVSDGWTRPTAIAGLNAAGYLVIVNRGDKEERLISASSPAAQSVTLHRSVKVGQVMTMRQVAFIAVPAHGQAVLAPGGFHLMLEHVGKPLHVGQKVALRLRFAGRKTLQTTLSVRSSAAAMSAMAM